MINNSQKKQSLKIINVQFCALKISCESRTSEPPLKFRIFFFMIRFQKSYRIIKKIYTEVQYYAVKIKVMRKIIKTMHIVQVY